MGEGRRALAVRLMEIERKFLVDAVPDDAERPLRIDQGYLALTDTGTEVRVRRWPDGAALTVKHGSGEVRTEVELKLDPEQFDELWPLTESARVHKERWRVPLGDLEVELDVYSGELEGLQVAEVEFDDKEAADSFEPPDWFGREVTDDERYANESLATRGRPD